MTKLATFAKALVVVLTLVFAASSGAQAQQATVATPSGGSFDAYQAVAVTAGVIGGAVVATIVTDGLILPAYGLATGSSVGPIGGGGAFAMLYSPGYAFFRGSMRLLGAISGGLYADSWYTGE